MLFRHDVSRCEINHARGNDLEFVIAGGNAANVFGSVEESFDQLVSR
jgi:hypothetical protein